MIGRTLEQVLNHSGIITIHDICSDAGMDFIVMEWIARDIGDPAGIGGFAASPDGRTLLYVRRDSAVDDLMLVEAVR